MRSELPQQKNHSQVIADLRKSLSWMDLVLSNLGEGVLVVDKDMVVLFANDAAAAICATPRILLLGLPIWEALPIVRNGKPVSKKAYQTALQKNPRGKSGIDSLSGTYELHRKRHTLKLGVTTGFIEGINQAVFVVRDITWQQRNERALLEEQIARVRDQAARAEIEESRNLLQDIIDGSPAHMSIKDLRGRYLQVNKQFENVYGIAKKDAIGKTSREVFRDLWSEKTAKALRAKELDMQRMGKAVEWETTTPTARGSRTFLVRKSPLFDAKGNVFAVCGISLDITERVEMEQRKDDFINMASHELKTPVTSMKVFYEITRKFIQRGDMENFFRYFEKIDDQLSKLTNLISELLNLSRIHGDRLDLVRKPFDLTALVEETVESVQAISEKHVILVRGPLKQHLVTADRDRIGQVLVNLLENAVKYSPRGGDIIVRTRNGAGHVTVSVQDSGIGIAREYHEKVFDRFYQASGATEKTFPGLGIGLYITSEIVKRHGGAMRVKSEKGSGSTFYFTLPVQ